VRLLVDGIPHCDKSIVGVWIAHNEHVDRQYETNTILFVVATQCDVVVKQLLLSSYTLYYSLLTPEPYTR